MLLLMLYYVGADDGGSGVGGFTRRFYGMIRDHRYLEAIEFLEDKIISYPTSRAALSLLGFCYFQVQSRNKIIENCMRYHENM